MAQMEPALRPGDYVVRYGLRDVLLATAAFIGWAGLGAAALISRPSPPRTTGASASAARAPGSRAGRETGRLPSR